MRNITIAPKNAFRISVEAENISTDKFAPLTLGQINSLVVWQGNRQKKLSDLFIVEGDDAPAKAEELTIRLIGDFSQVKRIAEGMTAGQVLAEESVGMHAGNNMLGGLLSIAGNADDWLAREMRGGKVVVMGNAGNYLGGGYRGEKCGMRGGEIEVRGSAGAYLGEHSHPWGCGRLCRSCQSGRHNLHRWQHLSARRRDEQRNYNRKRRGQGSAQLPEDRNRRG
jgi:formylmethanofuran dehydrogenase subunit C